MPATDTQNKSSNNGSQPIRQDLRNTLQHTEEIERLGISKEACQYLGAGHYPAGEKSRSPMAGRLVFQVRGCSQEGEQITPHVLSHVGVTAGENGKFDEWSFYPGFKKDECLYNIDSLLTDERAIRAAREDAFIILLQDPLDAAKLVGAGTYNVVSTFTPTLGHAQADQIEETVKLLGIKKVLIMFHRQEGYGQEQAVELLRKRGIGADGFNWEGQYQDRERGLRSIPDELTRVCEFTPQQVTFVVEKARQQEKWIRQKLEHGRAR